jgi:hypothetical protein
MHALLDSIAPSAKPLAKLAHSKRARRVRTAFHRGFAGRIAGLAVDPLWTIDWFFAAATAAAAEGSGVGRTCIVAQLAGLRVGRHIVAIPFLLRLTAAELLGTAHFARARALAFVAAVSIAKLFAWGVDLAHVHTDLAPAARAADRCVRLTPASVASARKRLTDETNGAVYFARADIGFAAGAGVPAGAHTEVAGAANVSANARASSVPAARGGSTTLSAPGVACTGANVARAASGARRTAACSRFDLGCTPTSDGSSQAEPRAHETEPICPICSGR